MVIIIRLYKTLLNVLDSSFKDVFTFEKYQDEDILRAEIERLLDEYPEKLQDFYKILKALTE